MQATANTAGVSLMTTGTLTQFLDQFPWVKLPGSPPVEDVDNLLTAGWGVRGVGTEHSIGKPDGYVPPLVYGGNARVITGGGQLPWRVNPASDTSMVRGLEAKQHFYKVYRDNHGSANYRKTITGMNAGAQGGTSANLLHQVHEDGGMLDVREYTIDAWAGDYSYSGGHLLALSAGTTYYTVDGVLFNLLRRGGRRSGKTQGAASSDVHDKLLHLMAQASPLRTMGGPGGYSDIEWRALMAQPFPANGLQGDGEHSTYIPVVEAVAGHRPLLSLLRLTKAATGGWRKGWESAGLPGQVAAWMRSQLKGTHGSATPPVQHTRPWSIMSPIARDVYKGTFAVVQAAAPMWTAAPAWARWKFEGLLLDGDGSDVRREYMQTIPGSCQWANVILRESLREETVRAAIAVAGSDVPYGSIMNPAKVKEVMVQIQSRLSGSSPQDWIYPMLCADFNVDRAAIGEVGPTAVRRHRNLHSVNYAWWKEETRDFDATHPISAAELLEKHVFTLIAWQEAYKAWMKQFGGRRDPANSTILVVNTLDGRKTAYADRRRAENHDGTFGPTLEEIDAGLDWFDQVGLWKLPRLGSPNWKRAYARLRSAGVIHLGFDLENFSAVPVRPPWMSYSQRVLGTKAEVTRQPKEEPYYPGESPKNFDEDGFNAWAAPTAEELSAEKAAALEEKNERVEAEYAERGMPPPPPDTVGWKAPAAAPVEARVPPPPEEAYVPPPPPPEEPAAAAEAAIPPPPPEEPAIPPLPSAEGSDGMWKASLTMNEVKRAPLPPEEKARLLADIAKGAGLDEETAAAMEEAIARNGAISEDMEGGRFDEETGVSRITPEEFADDLRHATIMSEGAAKRAEGLSEYYEEQHDKNLASGRKLRAEQKGRRDKKKYDEMMERARAEFGGHQPLVEDASVPALDREPSGAGPAIQTSPRVDTSVEAAEESVEETPFPQPSLASIPDENLTEEEIAAKQEHLDSIPPPPEIMPGTHAAIARQRGLR